MEQVLVGWRRKIYIDPVGVELQMRYAGCWELESSYQGRPKVSWYWKYSHTLKHTHTLHTDLTISKLSEAC